MGKDTMVATGWSNDSDSFKAGQEAGKMALDALLADPSITWAMVFSGGRHDADTVLQGLRDQIGEVQIVGGSAVGTITNEYVGYTGYECAVTVFNSPIPKPIILTTDQLDQGEFKAGQHLGRQLKEVVGTGHTVFLFYDTVRSGGPPPTLNTASKLLDGLYDILANKEFNIVGAGTVADFQLTDSCVFNGSEAVRQSAVAVVLPPILSAATIKMDGCVPLSAFMEITKADGPVIYEIDGKPALEVLREIMGEQSNDMDEDNISLIMTLGEKHGDLLAPFNESVYVNRLIVSTNPADGSVIMFEADFQVGTKIQVMTRDNTLMLESVKKRTRELLSSVGSTQPVWGLYIDCAGRCSAFTGSEVEDASILRTELGKEFPLLGFYSGVELAPLLGRTRPQDWTGVLTLFTMDDNR